MQNTKWDISRYLPVLKAAEHSNLVLKCGSDIELLSVFVFVLVFVMSSFEPCFSGGCSCTNTLVRNYIIVLLVKNRDLC